MFINSVRRAFILREVEGRRAGETESNFLWGVGSEDAEASKLALQEVWRYSAFLWLPWYFPYIERLELDKGWGEIRLKEYILKIKIVDMLLVKLSNNTEAF